MASLLRVVLPLGLWAVVGCVAPTSFELRDSGGAGDVETVDAEVLVDVRADDVSVDGSMDAEASDALDVEDGALDGSDGADARDSAVVEECSADTTLCGGACVDTTSDRLHCGACGVACRAEEACSAGRCGCAPPLMLCEGQCVDPRSNTAHCGRCGAVCPNRTNTMPLCMGGQCSFQCLPGTANCNMSAGDGCEVNLVDNRANCGACNRVCGANQRCNRDRCETCGGTTATLCGNECVDTRILPANRNHCGSCTTVCGSLDTCCPRAGRCATICL